MRGPNIMDVQLTATGWRTTLVGPIADEIFALDRRIVELEHACHDVADKLTRINAQSGAQWDALVSAAMHLRCVAIGEK